MNIASSITGHGWRTIHSWIRLAAARVIGLFRFDEPQSAASKFVKSNNRDTESVPPSSGSAGWSLRSTLLAGFLGLTSVALLIVTALSYISARDALHEEIRTGLQRDAEVLVQDIDILMFERIKDLIGWHHQEVMQDASINDVDKRLSRLLERIKSSYSGIFTRLYFLGPDGKVIASSERSDIGHALTEKPAPTWQSVTVNGISVTIDQPHFSEQFDTSEMALHIPVKNHFSGEQLGELYSVMDWSEIERLLQQASGKRQRRPSRLVLLLDRRGRFLGGSANARQRGLTQGALLQLRDASSDSSLIQLSDSRGNLEKFLASHADSSGVYDFSGLGLRVVIAEPWATAFIPVTRLLHLLLATLVLTLLAAVLVSAFLSRRISGPLIRLADFAHQFNAMEIQPPPRVAGVREVAELRGAFDDMTQRLKISQAQLVRASKLAAVGEMAATMAHEVRTPLGILQSSAQLLMDDDALSDEGREMVHFILDESERLNRLVTMLIECGRPRSPVFSSVDLNALVARVLEFLAQKIEARDITVACDLSAERNSIEADSEQLQQVLINLILNAVQILPQSGHIWIDTHRDAASVVLEISDNGPGIPIEERKRIFEPFVSHRSGGFGLGLSVVAQILHQHHATITVGEREGGGARFRIRFPIRY